MRCAHCGHTRTRLDPLPDTHCPDCGREYGRTQAQVDQGIVRAVPESARAPRRGGRAAAAIALLLVAAGASWYLLRPQPAPVPAAAQVTMKGSIPPPVADQPRVVMFATSWCPYCAKARRFFDKHAIRYVEHDVERDDGAGAAYRNLGGGGVPVILVGDEVVRGFDERRLRRLLAPWIPGKH
jgi:glutaredoxin